jgi:hypothetical protein
MHPFYRLPMEVEATASALKNMSKRHGIFRALGKSKLALAGHATYWLQAAGTAAIYGAIGKAVFGGNKK